jgi:hypothetical protein
MLWITYVFARRHDIMRTHHQAEGLTEEQVALIAKAEVPPEYAPLDAEVDAEVAAGSRDLAGTVA